MFSSFICIAGLLVLGAASAQAQSMPCSNLIFTSNVTIGGSLSVDNAPCDVFGPGGTLSVLGDLEITTGIWYIGLNVEVGGNFSVDATIETEDSSGISTIVFNGTTAQAVAINGSNASPANFDWTVASGATVNLNTGLTINSGVAGAGVLTNDGILNLATNGSISGSATIFIAPGATFNVSQASNGYTLTASQTLLGGGTIIGNVAAANWSVIHPGSGRTLTFSNNISFGSTATNIFDLTDSASFGNDQIVLNGLNNNLTCGGAQIVVNSAGTLATNDYVLFDVAGGGSISGAFNPAPAWFGAVPANSNDFSVVTSGTQVLLHHTVPVVPKPAFAGVSLSGTNLLINGTNGVAGAYVVLMSTNLASTSWMPVATNVLNGSGSFSFVATNVVNPNAAQQFYILQAP